MDDLIPMVFDKLTKDNYNTWRVYVEALLSVHDLLDYVKGDTESVLEDADRAKKDLRARSMIILQISSSLIPLVENCVTSREVWLELANICGFKDEKKIEEALEYSDTDEDAIINDIEVSVDDFFKIINDLSEKKLMEDKKSLSSTFTDDLFSQLKINGVTKLPEKQIIINTISDFIDVIDKLSKKEIEEQTNELSCKLIDILLVNFNINPHKNDNDEVESNADRAEIQDKVSRKLNSFDAREVAAIQRDTNYHKNELFTNDLSETVDETYYYQPQRRQPIYNERTPCQLYGQQEGCSPSILTNLYTPPTTPSPRRTYKCGVCRQEGHNRTKCPFNASLNSAETRVAPKTPLNKSESYGPKSTAKTTETPKRSYKCGTCGNEGHNRTSCPLNQSTNSTLKSAAETTATPKTSLNRTATQVPKPTVNASETPKRSYKCGICGEEGHNRTSCSLNKSAESPLKSATKTTATPETYRIGTYTSKPTVHTPETPKRSYKCGVCGEEGHNRTSCPHNVSVFTSTYPTAIQETPKKSYKCGGCGEEGHNITSCPRNSVMSTASTRSTNRCGTCGGEGHNSRTCGRRTTSSYTDNSPSYSSNVSTRSANRCGTCGGEGHNSRTCGRRTTSSYTDNSPSYSSNVSTRSANRCGTCGGEGHNSRTCGRRTTSLYTDDAPSPSYSYSSSYSSHSPPAPSFSGGRRSYTCGNCGGSGHNRRTCQG